MKLKDLVEIEKGFWFEGAEYYNLHILNEAMFVFPNMILGKEDGVSAADQAPRWDKLEREGSKPYVGSITTIYKLKDGKPKMVFHQHTPDTK